MRRADREVRDPERIEDVIRRCHTCRIGLHDGEDIYIVPLNFGYAKTDGAYTFYFHGAGEGKKLDLIRENPSVGFEMDTGYALHTADVACGHSARFESVIGTGTASIVTDLGEKRRGLSLLMEHVTGKGAWNFDEKMVDAVAIFKVEVRSLACKEHQ